MAGDEQRHELVAQLAVGHRLPVLVARREQHREHVVALLPGAAALVDQGEDQLVRAPGWPMSTVKRSP